MAGEREMAIREMVKQVVISAGYPHMMFTPYCEQHRETGNGSCKGCESDEGCKKGNDILVVMATSSLMLNRISSLGEMLQFQKDVTEEMKKILKKEDGEDLDLGGFNEIFGKEVD